MPCFLILVILLFPRVALLLTWFYSTYLQRAFHGGLVLPILGFLFLPLTTLVYAWELNTGMAADRRDRRSGRARRRRASPIAALVTAGATVNGFHLAAWSRHQPSWHRSPDEGCIRATVLKNHQKLPYSVRWASYFAPVAEPGNRTGHYRRFEVKVQ
jgi:hypothetical protein